MDDSELERTPNPFSAFADSRTHSRRNFASAAKFFLGTSAIFCLVTLSQVYLQRSRLKEIVGGFSGQTTTQKIEQLHHLQASGVAGIPGIVSAIADDQQQVSAAAFEIISDLNHQWMTLPTDQICENRLVFAEALVKLSVEINDRADPRWGRIQSLARGAAQDLVGSPGAENAAAYQSLVKIISVESGDPRPRGDQEMAADEPLPIDSVDIAAARWTDWPPTSSTPTLFRRDVATIDAIGDPNVVLRQTDHSDQPDPSEPRLLRPMLRPASTLAEQSRHIADEQSTSYWIAQLDSPSRLVRMKAVTELGNHGDRHAIKALKNHLNTESDHSVALLIRKRLAL